MGCSQSNKSCLIPMKPCATVNGVLKVTVEQAHIQKSTSKLFDMDPYIILRMSNQQFRGYIHKKAGRQPLFNESFEFLINSCYKCNGRYIQMQLWDECRFNDKMIGIGSIDLDPIIMTSEKNIMTSSISKLNTSKMENSEKNSPQMSRSSVVLRKNQCRLKVFLQKGLGETGFINVLFQFIQQPIQTVGFTFQYANLRRKSSLFTTMTCWIQVIAGQEILSTHKQKDKHTKNPPSWQQETLVLNIPKSLRFCTIRVMDDHNQIGRVKLSLSEITQQKGDHHFTQKIQHGQTVSGILKFTVSVGAASLIAQIKRENKIESFPSKQMKLQQRESKGEQEKQIRTQQGNQIKDRQQIQKQKKMQESIVRTAHYTHANQEQNSRVHTPENSRVVIENQ